MSHCFNLDCIDCPRLSQFLQDLRTEYPDYHNLPVAAFGDEAAQLLVIGLAPGMQGANATGRPFTGDASGLLLYETLYKYGFSSKPTSQINDDLQLFNCRITNAVKCLPPQNKPVAAEIKQCNYFLKNEMDALPVGSLLIALGSVAHDAILRAFNLKKKSYKFAHHAQHHLSADLTLIDSYHCSRYNTQTKRLTPEMFDAVFSTAQILLSSRGNSNAG